MRNILMLATILGVVACAETDSPNEQDASAVDQPQPSLQAQAGTGRWYTEAQMLSGREIFAANCAVCHGQNAEATPHWKTLDANGNYPPPPLNGSAHSWHHPLSVLKTVVEEGGKPFDGVMPAWKGTLNPEQITNVIAGFQSYWPDEAYQHWLTLEMDSH